MARITAQPLVVPNQSVRGKAPRSSVVYVVTDQDYLYAFDGDTGQKLGSRKFGDALPQAALPGFCGSNSSVVGITSAPVIDPQAGLIYLITDTFEVGQPVYRVHAVSLSTLQDTVTPAPIVSASASLLDGSQYPFNARVSRQRAALLLSGATLYASFASYCRQCRTEDAGLAARMGHDQPGHASGQLPRQSESAATADVQVSDRDMDVGLWTLHADRG